MFIAINRTKQENLNHKIDKRLPGIVFSGRWFPFFSMILYLKSAVQLYHRIGQTSQMICHIDATGGLINFPNVPAINNKVLHSLLSVSPKYMMRREAISAALDLLTPIKVAKYVSHRNTTDNYTA